MNLFNKSRFPAYDIGVGLDVGKKRAGGQNQDCIGLYPMHAVGKNKSLLVVADGMGGYQGGATASQIVVEQMIAHFRKPRLFRKQNVDLLKSGIDAAHQKIKKVSAINKDLASMGSTVVAVILERQRLTLGNVGDSRAYIVNENEIRQISFDHSFVAEQFRLGVIQEGEMKNHPKRNVLSMSLSAKREDIDPYFTVVELGSFDHVILCSDGLWGVVSASQIQQIVLELPAQTAAEKLVGLANQRQGPDNISVIVARRKAPTSAARDIKTDPNVCI